MIRPRTQDQKKASHQEAYPPPKLTRTGLRIALIYIALPILGLLAAADVLLYLYFRYVLGSCYGVLCLL